MVVSFTMLDNVNKIKKLEKILKDGSRTIEFNNRLPVSVQVLKKVDYTRYAIKLGNKEMTTKSLKELEIGAKYWGELANDPKSGMLNLSNLHKKPPFLQKEGAMPVAVEFEVLLKKVLSDDEPKKFVKEAIQEKMAQAQTREEFLYLTNLLFSLQQDVLSIPFKIKDKENFFQMKKRKSADKNSFLIDFYSTFNNLGELNGTILYNNGDMILYLKTPYEATKRFLEGFVEDLHYFSKVIITKEEVGLLYEFSNQLLDIKG